LREVLGELISPTPFLNVIEDAGEINSPKFSLTDKFGLSKFWSKGDLKDFMPSDKASIFLCKESIFLSRESNNLLR
jgi:hypothetical protein